QVHIGSKRESAPDHPAKRDPEYPAKETHYTRFGKKEAADVSVRVPHSFQNADFAAPLENGHYKSIDNSQRSDRERQAPKDPEKQIENGEDEAEIFSCV